MFAGVTLRNQRVAVYDPDPEAAETFVRRVFDTPDGAVWAGVGYREGEERAMGLKLSNVTEAVFTVDRQIPLTEASLVRDLYNGKLFNLEAVRPAREAALVLATGTTRFDARYTITNDIPAYTVAAVAVNPSTAVVNAEEALTFEATVTGQTGLELADRVPVWRSSDYAVIDVSADGTAVAVGVGTAEVTATVDGVVGTASVDVV